MNILFTYLYRDAANYKQWGEVVFANPKTLEPSEVEENIRELLIDKEFFVSEELELRDLHFEKRDNSLDHDWHEFDSCQSTLNTPTDPNGRTIDVFIESIRLKQYRLRH